MTRFLPAALLAAASILSGTAAIAATQTTTKTTKAATAPASATRTTRTTKLASAPTAMHAGSNHMVTTKTTTGKTVTYDCSKAGNKTKTACKK